MYFFFVYLFSIIVLGSLYIGPYSIRVYMTVLMLLFLLINTISRRKESKNNAPRSFIISYGVFVLFAGLALSMNGDFDYVNFPKLFLANYLNCFVTLFAIFYFVNNKHQLRQTFIFLSLLIGLDALITILQHYGDPLGQLVVLAFTNSAEYAAEFADNMGEIEGKMFGLNAPVGLLGHVHANAIYIACLGLFPLFLFLKRERFLYNAFWFVVSAVCIYACFCTQERAAFILLLFFALFFLYKFSKRRARIGLLVLVGVFVFTVLPTLLINDSLGRIISVESGQEERNSIWTDALGFLSQNFLWGGPSAFNKINPAGGHNFFLNAFINFGLFTAIIAIFIYFSMILNALVAYLKIKEEDVKILACEVLVFSAICQFHNASILTGDTLIFILYPLFLKALNIYGYSLNLLKRQKNKRLVNPKGRALSATIS